MAAQKLPGALKIFLMSLFFGAVGGYGAFRLAMYLTMRFIGGEYREILIMAISVGSALLVGMASAVTAGVIAGRARE